jgi:hypothetical protein
LDFAKPFEELVISGFHQSLPFSERFKMAHLDFFLYFGEKFDKKEPFKNIFKYF